MTKEIYCTGCEQMVDARLTDGKERYPHRPDLYSLPFWKCDTCGGYVGCHHKTSNPTKPLGFIATPAILDARKKIHAILDPLWKSGKIKRGQAYAYVGHRIGHPYHNGEIKTLEEAREIYKIVGQLYNDCLRKDLKTEVSIQIDRCKVQKLIDDGVISEYELVNAPIVFECECGQEQDAKNDICINCGKDIS